MSSRQPRKTTAALRRELVRLTSQMLFGTLSERYTICGHATCRCARGERHGPVVQISYRGPEGKTTGYSVPQALAEAVRSGVGAWHHFQAIARELADRNRASLGDAAAARRRRR
ncbi:MAG: DUF6788 family protein [Vicinamibacterales bacterium]